LDERNKEVDSDSQQEYINKEPTGLLRRHRQAIQVGG
jgi:hypothetical protein